MAVGRLRAQSVSAWDEMSGTVVEMPADRERPANPFLRHWLLTGLVSGFLLTYAVVYARDGELLAAASLAALPVLCVAGSIYLDRAARHLDDPDS